ncbi:MAG TPA: hypothetical protein VF511_05765 [Chthoniobacterales bacterium]
MFTLPKAPGALERRGSIRHSVATSMRSPHRWRNIAFGFFASGCVAIAAIFLLRNAATDDAVRMALVVYASTAILFGGGTAVVRHLDVRAKEALARGEEIIARWRVDPPGWRKFVEWNAQWTYASGALPNELIHPDEVPPDGVEVIAGKTAVQIGESIHRLPRRGTPEVTEAFLHDGRPAAIELRLYYTGGGHGASGVPVAATRSTCDDGVSTISGWTACQASSAFIPTSKCLRTN